jgi:predicted  nucleic acid-binding Zn-ribbon protein
MSTTPEPTHGQQCNDGLPMSPEGTGCAERCGAEHPTNPTAVSCPRDRGHLGAHQSSTGCAGSVMTWANLRSESGCSAHGDAKCAMCSRNTANGCSECSTVAEDGMHWDTCPNRDRTPIEDAPLDLRSEPEWLTSLRTDMVSDVGRAFGGPHTWEAVVDIATGVAASHMRPLHAKVEELESEVETGAAELLDALNEGNALQGQLARANDRISELGAEVARASEQASQVDDEYRAALAKANVEILALRDALTLKGEMLDEMRGRVRDRDGQIAGLNAEIHGLRATLESSGAKYRDRIQERDASVAKLRAEVEEMQAESVSFTVELRAVVKDRDGYRQRVADLTAQVDGLLQPAGGMEAKLQAMREDMVDEAKQGHVRIVAANAIAERHMLRTVAPKASGRVLREDEEPPPWPRIEWMATGATAPNWSPSPSPEMREVPVKEVRDGDKVIVSFTAHDGEYPPSGSGLWLSEFEGSAPSMFLTQDGLTVTRPVAPPISPEAALRALVAALKDPEVCAITAKDDVRAAWVDAVRALDGVEG